MCDRSSTIAADVNAAREVYIGAGLNKAKLSISRLELDEDSVCFEVAGFEGEFTAFVADPYPGGETTVYGPDDLVFSRAGTVSQVLDGVLQELSALNSQRLARVDGDVEHVGDDAGTGGVDDDGTDVEDVDDARDFANWIFDEAPMEQRLLRDASAVRQTFGADAVTSAQLAVQCWRLRLRVELVNSFAGRTDFLLDDTTASAWGMHPTNPLILELRVPVRGYLERSMSPAIVKAVWQEDHPSFPLERQMIQILTEFCASVLGGANSRDADPEEEDLTQSELEMIRKYAEKKALLKNTAKADVHAGFLMQLIYYTQMRIPTIHEFCAICDQPFVVPPMMLRTVCCRDLCTYQFAEFGDKITTAEGVNTQAEIVDLLVCMLLRAALSPRRDLILDPFPCVYGGTGGREKFFDPKEKNFDKLEECLEKMLTIRKECARQIGAAWSAMRSRMTAEGAALVNWVVASNRSFLAPLQDDERIEAFNTSFQYLLISAPPEREQRFQDLKKEHGSTFAYHGSPAENWHSILRNGLKNASHTKLMTNGAAYGSGIYLSLDSAMSLGYSGRQSGLSFVNRTGGYKGAEAIKVPSYPELKRQKTGNRFLEHVEGIVMLAVCEVIKHPSLQCHSNIWVAQAEEHVMTRFFLVYPDFSKNQSVPITSVTSQIEACMRKLRVGMPGRAP